MRPSLDLTRPDLPFALQVELTSHCNLACRMCPLTTEGTVSSVTPGHMEEVPLQEVVELASRVGEVIVAGFGEPLLSPRCLPFLEELDRRGVRMSIATNGTPLTPALAKRLAAIRHLGLINVSIDSPDPEVFRRIRGGDLARAVQGVANLMAEVDNPERVTVSSVLMLENVASLTAFPSLLARLGVRRYILQGFVDYVPAFEGEGLLGHHEVLPYVEELRAACAREGVALFFTLPDRLNLELQDPAAARRSYYGEEAPAGGTRQCSLPWEMPYVDKDGRVFPCCYAASAPETVLGDLRQSRLTDIWEGEAYQRFRLDLLHGETTPTICRTCTVARLGEHPLRQYSARLLLERSVLAGGTELCLVVRNTGTATWRREAPVRIGTADPRERLSSYHHPGWIGLTRVAGMLEEAVPPGGLATLRFQVSPAGCGPETFQLLVEGKVWLPNTRFVLGAPPPSRFHRWTSLQRLVSRVTGRPDRSFHGRRCR